MKHLKVSTWPSIFSFLETICRRWHSYKTQAYWIPESPLERELPWRTIRSEWILNDQKITPIFLDIKILNLLITAPQPRLNWPVETIKTFYLQNTFYSQIQWLIFTSENFIMPMGALNLFIPFNNRVMASDKRTSGDRGTNTNMLDHVHDPLP